MLSNDQIRQVFLANGFTVKEGQADLKPYVYDAAHELLALAAQQAPEVAEYQARMRATWRQAGEGWTEWEKVREAVALDYERTPIVGDWQFEVRRLYTPAAPGEGSHHAALQRIGTALGLLPGSDLHRECVPAIKALMDRAIAQQAVSVALPFAVLDALRFYANGSHFSLADDTAWDTVSGEPQNFWCDEAGTATVEDGSIAKAVLQGHAFEIEEPEPAIEGEVFIAVPADLSTSKEASNVG